MDFELNEEQRMLQDSVRQMVADEIEPALSRHDPDVPLSRDAMLSLMQICAAYGMTSARVPVVEGGAGLPTLSLGLMLEQLPSTMAWAVGAQEITISRIQMGGTRELKERFLPDLIGCRKIACTGTTEPDAGSDPRSIRASAVDDGDAYILNGTKMWVTNAAVCDIMMVTASTGTDADGLSRVMRILVDRNESPFTTRKISTFGLRQGHLGEASFVDCRVPKRNVIGEEGDASRVLTQTWLANRPIIGLYAVSLAQRAFDMARAYAADRSQFGRKIAGFQLVQQLLADIATAVTTSRLICYYALASIDGGRRANQVSAMAKRYAVSSCQKAVDLAMEIHGAMGISTELGLERLYRDVRMLRIPDGTDQILALIEGREISGIPAYRT